MESIRLVLEIFNYVAVIGGVIAAVIFYPRNEARREARERENSYVALNDHFLNFLRLQMDHPALGTNATDRARVWENLNDKDRDRQILIFDYLASLLERAHQFLRHELVAKEQWGKDQWHTWDHWIDRYCQNPNFVAFWQHLKNSRDQPSYGNTFLEEVIYHKLPQVRQTKSDLERPSE